MTTQQDLPFREEAKWGGARRGAGRPKSGRKPKHVPHVTRPAVSRHRPHHVTVRVARGTWNLRSQRCFEPIRGALAAVNERAGFRVVHFSVQHNHVHLIIEARDRRTLSNGMRALLIRVARGINGVMAARGRRIEDRYHEHVLRTPTETRNALRYVIRNRAHHLDRWGKPAKGFVDDYSSECPALEPLIHPPGSWLLREGWMKAGPLRANLLSDRRLRKSLVMGAPVGGAAGVGRGVDRRAAVVTGLLLARARHAPVEEVAVRCGDALAFLGCVGRMLLRDRGKDVFATA